VLAHNPPLYSGVETSEVVASMVGEPADELASVKAVMNHLDMALPPFG
jgi:hypothetical protein